VLMAYLVIVKIILIFFPGVFRSTAQAAVFEWKFLAIWTVIGMIGVFLAAKIGFPEIWEDKATKRKSILVAISLGLIFGVLAVITDVITGWTMIIAAKHGLKSIHIDFPASLLIYPGGAIIVNVIYRIFPIPVLLWLICGKLLKDKGYNTIFWVLAILTSLLEPFNDLGLKEYGYGMMISLFAQDFALNFSEAYLFLKYGFLTPILMRIVFYLIWHVSWGLAGWSSITAHQ
jgi:hypothetical protein